MILNPVRWWHCPSCDLRAREENAPDATVPTHPCPKWGGLEVHFGAVSGPDDRADVDHKPMTGEGRMAAMRTEHADGMFDVSVFGQPAGSVGDVPVPG